MAKKTQAARIISKRSTVASEIPTAGPSTDHTDGTWDAKDVYKCEIFINQVDGTVYFSYNSGITEIITRSPAFVSGFTQFNNAPDKIYTGYLAVTSGQILVLNGTPLQLVAAPPSGWAIVLISAFVKVTFASAAYATNTTLELVSGTNVRAQMQETVGLTSTASRMVKFTHLAGNGTANQQISDGVALNLRVATGNPTAGSGTIVVHYTYKYVNTGIAS